MFRLTLTLVLLCPALSSAVELIQRVSREHPAFRLDTAHLAVGRDGNVYLIGSGDNSGSYVIRTSPNGERKTGGKVVYAGTSVAANRDGIFATGNAHFSHSVNLYDAHFQSIGSINEFLNNDTVGWNAPTSVECGTSGDFYALDNHRQRILRISSSGKQLATFKLPDDLGPLESFRVSETASQFIVRSKKGLFAIGFDGKQRWTKPIQPAGYDLDEAGMLFVTDHAGLKISVFTPTGEPSPVVELTNDAELNKGTNVTDLRLAPDRFVVKRNHPEELFRTFDRTGKKVLSVNSAVDRWSVDYPNEVWKAGEEIAITIKHSWGDPGPKWRVWLRPFNTPDYREIPWQSGRITVPTDLAGIYQLKIGTDVRGGESEFQLQSFVEIRQPNARGSATVLTPSGRYYYARGEEIPLRIFLRGTDNEKIKLSLSNSASTIASEELTLSKDQPTTLTIPKELTSALLPGKYRIHATVKGLNVVEQHIEIGAGELGDPKFLRVQYGDYDLTSPWGDVWSTPDLVARHLSRSRKLGINLFVERIGIHLHVGRTANGGLLTVGELQDRFKDPLSPAPELARIQNPLLQTMSGYSANGMREMAILLYMDAGLPVGTGFDQRPRATLERDIAQVTNTLKEFPSFRGWAWNANWWAFQLPPANLASADEKTAYQAALKLANETGKWDPVLDRASDLTMGYAVDGESFFREQLRKHSPTEISAISGPYRNITVYPPKTFANTDEVDLHYQAEQIQPPNTFPHNVDFQKRPGKRAWGHPEIWNDAGTGDQIIPTLWSMAMRGADGVGCSGKIPNWGRQPTDDRSGYHGTVSVFRAINRVFEQYGSWLTTLKNADRVGIVVSSRMFRIDSWKGIGGQHFDRLFEAYQTCLYAGHPASFLFIEDITPETWKQYRIALLIDERIEFDPKLRDTLIEAKGAGVHIFHDGSCRAELVKDFTPLGIAFDHVSRDPHTWQDDSAYYRFEGYYRENLPLLRAKLDPIVSRVAKCEDVGVLMSERRNGVGRFLFVVNNTLPEHEPGQMWRVGLGLATKKPLLTTVDLGDIKGVVYDVFAQKLIPSKDGKIAVDLRTMPMRLFAILPESIQRVKLKTPVAVRGGTRLDWEVAYIGASGPIDVSLPFRVILMDGNGQTLFERFTATRKGSFITPINVPSVPGEQFPMHPSLTMVFNDLINGKTDSTGIGWNGVGPLRLEQKPTPEFPDMPIAQPRLVSWVEPVESQFGIHFRDVAVHANSSTVVLSAFQRDGNLFAIDLGNGIVKWRQRTGSHFAYAPQFINERLYVQNFDFATAEGYHLTRFDPLGTPERRFATYAFPKRLTNWMSGGILVDRSTSFVVSPDESWIAAQGDLGLIVWDKNGKKLWSVDWWENTRRGGHLLALSPNMLILGHEQFVFGHDTRTGQCRLFQELSPTGTVQRLERCSDGKTYLVATDTDGGRIFVMQGDQPLLKLNSAADEMLISDDAQRIVIVKGRQLRVFDKGSLTWTFDADDELHFAKLNFDGRIAVSSELGMLYVLDATGKTLFESDRQAITVPAFLPDGGMLLASWMGTVTRLDNLYRPMWQRRYQPDQLLEASDDKAPTARAITTGNALPKPLPLTPNLLASTKSILRLRLGEQEIAWQEPYAKLYDGLSDAPTKPWMSWSDVQMIDSGWRGATSVEFDTFRTQIRLTGITFVEDAKHPESWVRDVKLQAWNAAKESWFDVQYLVSNEAIHSHQLKQPVESSRFRLVSSGGTWPVSNLRCAEIVFHGESLGGSHPDVIAKRPVAVLFDEEIRDIKAVFQHGHNPGFTIVADESAYSGSHSFAFDPKDKPDAAPAFQSPFGHQIPHWDFEIVEKPEPGQYRYLQFAVRGLTPTTKRATLGIGPIKLAESVGTEWKVITVDLWELNGKKPFRVHDMRPGAEGGPVRFDRIVLTQKRN